MAFTTSHPLRFGDCDPSGIAYFPSYLNTLVGVVEDFFAELGTPWSKMVKELGIGTPTVRLDITFVKPGYHGDMLEFAVHVRKLGRSSVDLEHRISAGGDLLWSANQRLVAVTLETQKSCAWPDDIRAALDGYLEV